MTRLQYPEPRKDESIVEDHFGVKIADPYRWMEDLDSPDTAQFVTQQNQLTMPFIDSCPYKKQIKDVLMNIWDYERYGCPFKRGDKYFYFHNSGLQNQSILYVLDSLEGEPRVFLDPNEMDSKGLLSLNGYSFSDNGQYLCYGLSSSGSDCVEIHFKEVNSGRDLPDILKDVKFSCMSWTHDNKGCFYAVYQKDEGKAGCAMTLSNENQKLMYHRLGTPQDQDILCVERPDNPTWLIFAEVTECGRYVIVTLHQGCESNNQIYFCDLETIGYNITGKLPLTPIVDHFESAYSYVINDGPILTLRTNLDAPMYRLITVDLTQPNKANWKELVPHNPSVLLEWASCIHNDNLMICNLIDVKSSLSVHDLKTGEKKYDIQLPTHGTIANFSGRKRDTQGFFHFTSFLVPGTIYSFDFSQPNQILQVFREAKVKDVDLTEFIVEQVFYFGKDNTKIPMFIVFPKDFVKDSSRYCLLYGYGGFELSLTPSFSLSRILLMRHFGGVYAIPNIRGGGEYGEKWYHAGRREKKQNSFDDFQQAAQYLIDNMYTTNSKIIIHGGSNGGLLVGACCNQRPDLFAAAIVQVPVMDVLRFHKFTIGHSWTSDFGNPETKEDFEVLIKYSPLHNIKLPTDPKVQYPAILLLTADHDDRVVPLHSLKYIATLQEIIGKNYKNQENPLLIRIETKAGHGVGKPTQKRIEELVDIFAFLQVSLNMPWKG